MNKPEWALPPTTSAGDVLHGIVKAGLSIKAGPLGDLFAFVVRAPFERRMEDWIDRCEMRFRHLAERDRQIIERLPDRAEFISLFISATQAAVRTHHDSKLKMLAAAVTNAAAGIDFDADLQLMFVRFVDELTPSHFALLSVLAEHEATAAELEDYDGIKSLFSTVSGARASAPQFKLLCNDLEARMLARFSETLGDFPGIAFVNSITTEDSGIGPKVAITDLGHNFLRFVADSSEKSSDPLYL